MDKHEALQIIDATLKAKGFREVGPGPAEYEGQVNVHGQRVNVAVSIPDVRFATKPCVRLKDRSQIPQTVLAHVEQETGICYASDAGMPLDLYQPGQAILRVLAEAVRTLELSYRGRGRAELIDEYQHYWFPRLNVRSFLPRTCNKAELDGVAFFAMRGGEAEFLSLAPTPELRGYLADSARRARIWYVDDLVGPAGGIGKPSTLAELKEWSEAQSGLQRRFWQDAFEILASEGFVFIAAPNAFLGLKLVIPLDISAGVQRGAIRRDAIPKILLARRESLQVDRLSASWCDLDEITGRNSGDARNLSDTSIALIGAGTIGSHLARMLVQCGAGSHARFTVFDTQILGSGNIGRHLLGFEAVGEPKVQAVKAELERFHPQVKVDSREDDALGNWSLLSEHDLVIDATGDWNAQSTLNENFMNSDGLRPKALLHSFVFMNGAGVQSFLNLRDKHGCFRCLKPKFDGPWRYPAGDEREELNLRPASCGDGSYIPFTVEASTMAASLANRAALDWVNGRPGPRLRTAVVDVRRGRYHKPISPPPSPHCPACASFRSVFE